MKTQSSTSVLHFTDICVKVKDRFILQNVNGRARSGNLLAIMGPTGSGKTTLLNAIFGSLELTSGHITLNGKPYTKHLRRKLSYVLQSDIFFTRLTLQELLYFTAMIRIPDSVSYADKMARIDEVLDALDLRKCLKTVIGDFAVRGLSGGEKKRANIACELLTDPDIMLLDEPTSGLDSNLALSIMQRLRDYATQYNKTILVTIHQPSSQVYDVFSSLLLLVEGNVAYFGDVSDVLNYFDHLGFRCREHYNPADFLLELMKTEKETVEKILKAAKLKRYFKTDPSLTMSTNRSFVSVDGLDSMILLRTSEDHKSDSVKYLPYESHEEIIKQNPTMLKTWQTSFWTQYRMLTWRNVKQARGRLVDQYSVISTVVIALIMSLAYFQIQSSVDTLRDRMGVIFFSLILFGFNVMMTTLAGFPEERNVIKKEREAESYRLSAYYCAKMSSELPFLLVLPSLYLTIVYWMSGIGNIKNFFICIGLSLVHCLIIQSIAFIVGASVTSSFRKGVVISQTIMIGSIAFGGYYTTTFPDWLLWGKYMSFLYYPFAAMMTILFGNISPFSCEEVSFSMCKNGTGIITGNDVLRSVGIDLPLYCYLGTMAIFVIVLRILGYVALKYKGP